MGWNMASDQLLALLRSAPMWLAAHLEGVSSQTIRRWIKEGKRRGGRDAKGHWRCDVSHHVTGKAA